MRGRLLFGEDALYAVFNSDSGFPGSERGIGMLATKLGVEIRRVIGVIKAVTERYPSHWQHHVGFQSRAFLFSRRNTCSLVHRKPS